MYHMTSVALFRMTPATGREGTERAGQVAFSQAEAARFRLLGAGLKDDPMPLCADTQASLQLAFDSKDGFSNISRC